MVNFLEKLDEAYEELLDLDDIVAEFFFEGLDEEELSSLKEEVGLTDEEYNEILESLKRSVSHKGEIVRRRSRIVRSRRATLTTGLSKAKLKLRARKAVKTKKRNPSTQRKANKRRKRAMRIRKQRGIK